MKRYYSELLGATIHPFDNTLFFWHGIFSQWADATFFCNSLHTSVNCAEQAMMLHKAKCFGDQETYDAILATKHPRDQKSLGRMVKNYDDAVWSKVRFNIIKDINYDKFNQLKAWRELLFLTHPYELVEASPSDPIWGIGMGVDNPNILNRDMWGQNLLGKAITEARKELMNVL